MRSIVNACKSGQIKSSPCIIISNNSDAPGLDFAKEEGIETAVINHRSHSSREAFDQALVDILNKYSPELIVLAGFMRILSSVFTSSFSDRIINIHPSLLPLYPGLNTHRKALQAGDKKHGVSVHFVTEKLDCGPVILQAVVDVDPSDTEDSLAARILLKEHIIYPKAVEWFINTKIRFVDGQCLFDNSAVVKPGICYNETLTIPKTSDE